MAHSCVQNRRSCMLHCLRYVSSDAVGGHPYVLSICHFSMHRWLLTANSCHFLPVGSFWLELCVRPTQGAAGSTRGPWPREQRPLMVIDGSRCVCNARPSGGPTARRSAQSPRGCQPDESQVCQAPVFSLSLRHLRSRWCFLR